MRQATRGLELGVMLGVALLIGVLVVLALASERLSAQADEGEGNVAAALATGVTTNATAAPSETSTITSEPSATATPSATETPRPVVLTLRLTELASATPTASNTPTATATPTVTNTPLPLPELAEGQTGVEFVLGQSVEGRDITGWYATPPGISNPPQALILVGAIHGDESNSLPVLEQVRADITFGSLQLPPNVGLYIIPLLNPDGNERFSRFNANRIDLNRNWDTYDWRTDIEIAAGTVFGGGGPQPFSEPETMAMRDWLLAREAEHPDGLTVIYFHSQFPPDGMVVPGTHLVNGRDAADAASRRVGQTFANGSGYPYQNLWTGGYSVTGDASTWAVAQGMRSFTVEAPVRRALTDEEQADMRAGIEAVLVLLALGVP